MTSTSSDNPTPDPQSQPYAQPSVIPHAATQNALPDDGKGKAYKEVGQERRKPFSKFEKWVIVTNIVLALIGLRALWIYDGQLRVMRGQLDQVIKQYPEIQKSANAAKSAADTADATLKEIQKGGTDTHALAEAAEKQADASRHIADRTLQQARATDELAKEGKRSTDAARSAAETAASQLELAERPWVDAAITIDGPLYFNVNGANITLKIALRDTGHSPAFSTTISPVVLIGHEATDAGNHVGQVCGMVNLSFGVTLFPNVNFEQQEGVGIGQEEIDKSSKEFPGDRFPGLILSPAIVVCILYQPMFKSSTVYHTAYIFDLYKLDSENHLSDRFKIGEDVDSKHLTLRMHVANAISAN